MSTLEFKEVSQIDLRMEVRAQFPFRYADGSRWAVTKVNGEAVIFELSRISDGDQPFHLRIDEIQPTGTLSVIGNDESDEILKLYRNAEPMDRQFVGLDPVYANILSMDPLPQHVVSISMGPVDPNFPLGCAVAIATNAGVCEVRVRRDNLRLYDHVLVDISKIWKDYCARNRPRKFKTLTELSSYVKQLVFTCVCFASTTSESKHLTLMCATKSGLIVTFAINGSNAVVKSTTQTDLGVINLLEYLAFGARKDNEFVFVSSINGRAKVYRKNTAEEYEETATLWDVIDRMAFRCMEVRYDDESEQVVLATAKASHFLVFFLSKEGVLLHHESHYGGLITGIQHFENNQYIVSTLTGTIEQYTITGVTIATEEIHHDIDAELYQVLGMTTTIHKVAWIFLQFPILVYEHNFKNPTMLTVFSFNRKNAVKFIQSNIDKKLYELADCMEIIRCTFVKYGSGDISFELDCSEGEMNEVFIKKLKIFTIVLHARMCSFKKRGRSDDAQQTKCQILSMRKVLETYLAYKRLLNLSKRKEFTSVQKIAGVYFRKKMLDFCQDDSLKWLGRVQNDFGGAIKKLISEAEAFNQAECEQCAYCDGYVDLETGRCKDDHEVPRCCISFLQIQLFGARACDACQYAAIDDENLLKQVMYPGEKISCPLCDGALVGPKCQNYLI